MVARGHRIARAARRQRRAQGPRQTIDAQTFRVTLPEHRLRAHTSRRGRRVRDAIRTRHGRGDHRPIRRHVRQSVDGQHGTERPRSDCAAADAGLSRGAVTAAGEPGIR